jgi:hypothetical protein
LAQFHPSLKSPGEKFHKLTEVYPLRREKEEPDEVSVEALLHGYELHWEAEFLGLTLGHSATVLGDLPALFVCFEVHLFGPTHEDHA